MKSLSLALALAVSATPALAQTSPDTDDVAWDEPENLKAMILECTSQVTMAACVDTARANAQKYNVPTYIVYHGPNGKMDFYKLGKNAIERAYAEDILPFMDMDGGSSFDHAHSLPSPSLSLVK
jgi:hypothetical protein